jgi:AraC family transcriptional regulator
MSEQTTYDFSVVAAQLMEAAVRVRDGDGRAAAAHIANAMALLRNQPDRRPAPAIRTGEFAAWQVRRLTDYMNANLANKIYVEDLAALLGLSTSHFSRTFKSTFSVPVHTWLIRKRVEVAQGLMLTSEEPLSDIALTCGMSDQSHFTRAFRRVVGETPNAWRRSRRRSANGLSPRVELLQHPPLDLQPVVGFGGGELPVG